MSHPARRWMRPRHEAVLRALAHGEEMLQRDLVAAVDYDTNVVIRSARELAERGLVDYDDGHGGVRYKLIPSNV